MIKEIGQSIDDSYAEMVEIRRYLHQHPELSFKEYKTAAYIIDFYEKLNIPYESQVGGNGIIATLKGGKPGKTVALRADFDGLPIQDEKDVAYKSKNDGVMHACGHDGHTASLLVLAKVLQQYKEKLPGTIVFIHQHAEESLPGGAKSIVESGKLDHVDAVFGNHLWATVPLGEVQTKKGPFMAGADKFEITIQGQGGHGAYPHETKDAVIIGTEVVSQLQTIISRKINPLKTAIISIGRFEAGETFNIIADKAFLYGTVRYLNPEIQEQIMKEIDQVIKGVCLSYDVDYTLNYTKGYPPVINHLEETDCVLEASNKITEITSGYETETQMGGEDFAYYLMEKPGAFFFTGAKKDGSNYPHHHPKFDIDEKALPIAAKVLLGVYYEYQKNNNFI